MNWDEFISSEKASLDTIDVKRIYIDMAGDLVSGVLLSQIVYWHLLSKSGEVRLTVEKDGKYWLAKKRYDWWDECRITPKQFDRSINVLEERQTVITQVFRYNGSPTKHIRINRDVFVAVYNAMLSYSVDFVKFQGGKWILTKGEYRTLPLGNIELPERGITEAPRKPAPAVAPTLVAEGPEITTETTTKNKELINKNSFKQNKDSQQHPIVNSLPDNSQTEDTGENVNPTELPSNPSETQDNREDLNGGPATSAPAAHSFLTMITQFQNAMKKGVKQAILNGMLTELLEKLGVKVKKKNGDYNYSVAGKGWKLKKGKIIDVLYLMHQKKASGELNSPTGYWYQVVGGK